MRLRPLTSATLPRWMDNGALPYRSDATPVSDAKQLTVNTDSAQSTKALPITPARLRRVHEHPSQDRQNKRI